MSLFDTHRALLDGALTALATRGHWSPFPEVPSSPKVYGESGQADGQMAVAVMAFQAEGPHAQDRALEAIASAWKVMADIPSSSVWEKPQGKNPSLVMKKHFDIVGRGVALVIGCATFPSWNTYPGLFAALATGNPAANASYTSTAFVADRFVVVQRREHI